MLTSDLQKHEGRQVNPCTHVYTNTHKMRCGMLKTSVGRYFCMLSPLEAGEVSHVPAFQAFTPTLTPVPFLPLLPSEAKGLLSCGNHVNMVARECLNSL